MRRRCAAPLLGVVVALLVVSAVLRPAPPALAGTVLRGVDDAPLPTLAPDARARHLQEIARQLRAAVLRVDCQWPLAEPAKGQYSDSGYLGGVVATVEVAQTQLARGGRRQDRFPRPLLGSGGPGHDRALAGRVRRRRQESRATRGGTPGDLRSVGFGCPSIACCRPLTSRGANRYASATCSYARRRSCR